MTTAYFRGSQGIALVYDVTNRESFDSIRNWLSQIEQNCDSAAVNKILIGNNLERSDERVILIARQEHL